MCQCCKKIIAISIFLIFITTLLLKCVDDIAYKALFDEPSLLASVYTLLIGFVITSISILVSLQSKPMINLSRNGNATGLTIVFSSTLITLTSFLFFLLLGKAFIIFKVLFIVSLICFLLFTFFMLEIFYKTFKDLAFKEARERGEENILKEERQKVLTELKLINTNLLEMSEKLKN